MFDDVQDNEHLLALQEMIADSTKENFEDSSTPIPITATMRAPDSDDDQSEKGHLIPIHPEFEEDLGRGEYDSYAGGAISW